jgi:hypothetical protein
MRARPELLFHTVVVVGVTAGQACGGATESTTGGRNLDGGGGDGATSSQGGLGGGGESRPVVEGGVDSEVVAPPGVFWVEECEYSTQYRCESYAPLAGCVCDPTLPKSADECGGAQRIDCADTGCSPSGGCVEVNCRCVPDAPLAPEDCPSPGQFTCEQFDPEPRTCSCDPDRPGGPEACAITDQFQCRSYAPFTQCTCNVSLPSEVDCVAAGCEYHCVSESPRFGCVCDGCPVHVR